MPQPCNPADPNFTRCIRMNPLTKSQCDPNRELIEYEEYLWFPEVKAWDDALVDDARIYHPDGINYDVNPEWESLNVLLWQLVPSSKRNASGSLIDLLRKYRYETQRAPGAEAAYGGATPRIAHLIANCPFVHKRLAELAPFMRMPFDVATPEAPFLADLETRLQNPEEFLYFLDWAELQYSHKSIVNIIGLDPFNRTNFKMTDPNLVLLRDYICAHGTLIEDTGELLISPRELHYLLISEATRTSTVGRAPPFRFVDKKGLPFPYSGNQQQLQKFLNLGRINGIIPNEWIYDTRRGVTGYTAPNPVIRLEEATLTELTFGMELNFTKPANPALAGPVVIIYSEKGFPALLDIANRYYVATILGGGVISIYAVYKAYEYIKKNSSIGIILIFSDYDSEGLNMGKVFTRHLQRLAEDDHTEAPALVVIQIALNEAIVEEMKAIGYLPMVKYRKGTGEPAYKFELSQLAALALERGVTITNYLLTLIANALPGFELMSRERVQTLLQEQYKSKTHEIEVNLSQHAKFPVFEALGISIPNLKLISEALTKKANTEFAPYIEVLNDAARGLKVSNAYVQPFVFPEAFKGEMFNVQNFGEGSYKAGTLQLQREDTDNLIEYRRLTKYAEDLIAAGKSLEEVGKFTAEDEVESE